MSLLLIHCSFGVGNGENAWLEPNRGMLWIGDKDFLWVKLSPCVAGLGTDLAGGLRRCRGHLLRPGGTPGLLHPGRRPQFSPSWLLATLVLCNYFADRFF